MFLDQNPNARLVHAGLCSDNLQFFFCALRLGLEFRCHELPTSLIGFGRWGYERNSLLVVLRELLDGFLHFLVPLNLEFFSQDDFLLL